MAHACQAGALSLFQIFKSMAIYGILWQCALFVQDLHPQNMQPIVIL